MPLKDGKCNETKTKRLSLTSENVHQVGSRDLTN